MRRLANLSGRKVIAMAIAWPALCLVVPAAAFAYTGWREGRGVDAGLVGVWVDPGGWWVIAALLFVPPLTFLAAWKMAKRSV